MKKLLILLLLPITIFSQENHFDTTIARLINEKINEYRVNKGRYNLIQTDRFKSETEQYCVKTAEIINATRRFEHSSIFGNGKYSEVCCFVPFNHSELSADSLAYEVVDAYMNSRSHNVAILDVGITKIHTSVYIYYDPKHEDWALYTATQIMDWEYEIDIQYDRDNLEY